MAGKKDLRLSVVQGPEARSVSNTWKKEVRTAVESPEGEAFVCFVRAVRHSIRYAVAIAAVQDAVLSVLMHVG